MNKFWTFTIAASLSKLGNSFLYVAVPLAVLEATGSSFAAVASLTAQSAPYFLSPFISSLIDGFNRKRLFIASELLAVAFVSLIPLALQVHSTLGVFVLIGLIGLVSVVSSITSDFVIIPKLAPDRIDWAYSRYNSGLQFARMAGPAVAGVVLAVVGSYWALWADAMTFLISAFAGLVLTAVPRSKASLGLRAIADGARMFFTIPGIWQTTLSLALYNLGTGGLYALLLVVGTASWGWTAGQVGLLLSAGAMASAVGAWIVARIGASRPIPARIAIWLLVATVASLTLSGQVAAIVSLGYCGVMLADGALNVVTMIFRQRCIPDAYVGRVNAWIRMFLMGSIALSGLLTAAATSLTSLPYTFVLPTILVVCSFACWHFLRPDRRAVDASVTTAGAADPASSDEMEIVFGTDGIRGVVHETITPQLLRTVARRAAHTLIDGSRDRRPVAVMARDTRPSSQTLATAFSEGLADVGVDTIDLGVAGTPMAAFLTRELEADLGAVVTASHNSSEYNGLKLFTSQGRKLTDSEQDAIATPASSPGGPPAASGTTNTVDGLSPYVTYLIDQIRTPVRRSLRLVIDCGNGAAVAAASATFATLPVDVQFMNADGDGARINTGCGATDLTGLRERVTASGADAGFAFDGDADRCLAVDELGRPVTGEQILGLLAIASRRTDRLAHRHVVTTVMSNCGLDAALAKMDIGVTRVPVGDRNVTQTMSQAGLVLGGESSGHIMIGRNATCGDGLLTALHVIAEMSETCRPLSVLAAQIPMLPEANLSIAVPDPGLLVEHESFVSGVRSAREGLSGQGRVLVRVSGTEPVVRILVEGRSPRAVEEIGAQLSELARTCAAQLEGVR